MIACASCRLPASTSASHRPPEARRHPSGFVGNLASWKVACEEAAGRANDFFERRGFDPATPLVFDRPYRPPVFWLVVPRNAPSAAHDYLVEERRATVNGWCRDLGLSDDLRDSALASGVLAGELLAVRRFRAQQNVQGQRADQPQYLLMPAATTPDRAPVPAGRSALETQEAKVARVILDVSTLGRRAAAKLFQTYADLEVWDNHLTTYERAADDANGLWDGLATHLLLEGGRWGLSHHDRVHRSVGLLHQVLVQGVADVESITTTVSGLAADLDRASADLAGEFDRRLSEIPQTGSGGVRGAPTDTGHFAAIRTRAREVTTRATRVQDNYRSLLQTMAATFDERRARDTDVVSKAGGTLGAFLAIFALVTFMDATFDGWKLELNSRPDLDVWLSPILFGGSIALAVFLLLWTVPALTDTVVGCAADPSGRATWGHADTSLTSTRPRQ